MLKAFFLVMRGFHETMVDFNSHDLPMEAYQYTWARRIEKHDDVEEKLDCYMTILEWMDLFSKFWID